MKDLLSKDDYCYKIHTLTKSSGYPPFIDNPPYMDPSFYGFSKISTPIDNGRSVHIM